MPGPFSISDSNELPIPIGVCELDGTLVHVNRAGTALADRSLSEIVGKKAWDFAPGAEHLWAELTRTAIEQGQFRGDITLATPLGPREVHYVAVVRSVDEKTRLVIFGLGRDPSADRMAQLTRALR